jgi:hypothetical protein
MEADGARRRLEEQLREIGIPYGIDRDGDIAIPYANTTTFLRAFDQAGRPVVKIWAITNVDVPISDELTRFLLTENATLAFGGFQADESGRVGFSHTLLGGELLQRRELETALTVVVATADRYNDVIKARFGGKRFGES